MGKQVRSAIDRDRLVGTIRVVRDHVGSFLHRSNGRSGAGLDLRLVDPHPAQSGTVTKTSRDDQTRGEDTVESAAVFIIGRHRHRRASGRKCGTRQSGDDMAGRHRLTHGHTGIVDLKQGRVTGAHGELIIHGTILVVTAWQFKVLELVRLLDSRVGSLVTRGASAVGEAVVLGRYLVVLVITILPEWDHNRPDVVAQLLGISVRVPIILSGYHLTRHGIGTRGVRAASWGSIHHRKEQKEVEFDVFPRGRGAR